MSPMVQSPTSVVGQNLRVIAALERPLSRMPPILLIAALLPGMIYVQAKRDSPPTWSMKPRSNQPLLSRRPSLAASTHQERLKPRTAIKLLPKTSRIRPTAVFSQ